MRFREPWVRLLWVFALFLLQLRILNLWQFVSDDGHTLLAALDFLEGPARWTWLGPTSSVGARHPPFVYFVWSLLLRLHFSLTTVQAGILLQQAAAHWLLIGIGTRLRGPAAGYFASALYFLAPSFYAEYSLRFWEPAGLPLATMFGLYCAVKLVDDSRGSWLPVACAAALFATGGHLNALMLFPALGAIALENRRRIRWKCWQIVVAGLLAFLALIPVFTWKKAGYYVPPGTGIAVALGLILVG